MPGARSSGSPGQPWPTALAAISGLSHRRRGHPISPSTLTGMAGSADELSACVRTRPCGGIPFAASRRRPISARRTIFLEPIFLSNRHSSARRCCCAVPRGADRPVLWSVIKDPEAVRLTGSPVAQSWDDEAEDRFITWDSTGDDERDWLDLAVIDQAMGACGGEVGAIMGRWQPQSALSDPAPGRLRESWPWHEAIWPIVGYGLEWLGCIGSHWGCSRSICAPAVFMRRRASSWRASCAMLTYVTACGWMTS